VVSNGVQIEETNLDKTKKLTHWIEQTPISTKIMVIGVAQFAVVKTSDDDSIPVTAWYIRRTKKMVFTILPLLQTFFNFLRNT